MTFGDILRFQRKKARLNQLELSKKSNLNQCALSHFESGRRKPGFDNLRKLADALNISMDVLLGREDILGKGATEMEAFIRNARKLNKKDFDMLSQFSNRLADND